MDRHNKYFGKLAAVMRYAAMIGKHSASGRKVKDGVRFSALFLQKGVSMMTDYEMLSIVIMIITLVVSLLINNRDKKSRDATQR